MGLDWAPVHRSAIALDDGRLTFANDEDLTPATRVIRGVADAPGDLSGCKCSYLFQVSVVETLRSPKARL